MHVILQVATPGVQLLTAGKRSREEGGGGREEQEEEEKEGGDNRAAFNKEDRTTRKVLSWMETAARAGVLTSVTRTNEEESNCTAMPLPKKREENSQRI